MTKLRRSDTLIGWVVAVVATTVYMLTMEPTVSFWDCGEFIATSYGLEVGHPPGAPLYTLLAHCFMLLAGSPERVAWWSNTLSAVAGGLTAMFLYWTICRLIGGERRAESGERRTESGVGINNFQFSTINFQFSTLPALVGTACYLFCDTAWFSAVESEVYSLSMLFSSAIVWAMVRWAQCDDQSFAPRWLMLTALLLGLSVCVHQLSLLTIPALLVIYFSHRRKKCKFSFSNCLFSVLFFFLGLTPYLIIPIRAAADPPVNMGAPSTLESFHDYYTRSQYEHAPLLYGRCYNSPVVAFDEKGKAVYAPEMDMFFPRMWKHGTYSDLYYNDWCGRHGKMVTVGGHQFYKPSQGDNLVVFAGYQVGYMYLRYLMWNYSGRYNDRQGFGNLQKGQFITGIPFLDRLYVGTSASIPQSMPRAGHNRYFMLPLLLGLVGMVVSFRLSKRWGWTLMTLFLMSSLALSVYLNHPMYEPRERDYAYILSFYTFAIWIAMGALSLIRWVKNRFAKHPVIHHTSYVILLIIPALMAFQNWDDHDRSGCYVARDTARVMLESCDRGALLFTLGDNDTFPLWYMQEVEKFRTDVQVINISLLGSESYARSIAKQLARKGYSEFEPLNARLSSDGPYRRMMSIIDVCGDSHTPHFSHYAQRDQRTSFDRPLQLCGMVYRLSDTVSTDTVDIGRCHRLMTGALRWESLDGVYISETSQGFLHQYWHDAILAAENLVGAGRIADARQLLDTTASLLPVDLMRDPQLTYQVSQAYVRCGDTATATALAAACHRAVGEQLDYYATMKPSMQQYIPYTITPLRELHEKLMLETNSLQR